jgi:hypothetical protein
LAEEFAADAFALRISDEVEKQPVIPENLYLLSGAGALILLMSLDPLRAVEDAMGAKPVESGTHPIVTERIERFETIRLLLPRKHRRLKGFRTANWCIMRAVHEMIVAALESMPADVLEGFRRQRAEFEQWKDIQG